MKRKAESVPEAQKGTKKGGNQKKPAPPAVPSKKGKAAPPPPKKKRVEEDEDEDPENATSSSGSEGEYSDDSSEGDSEPATDSESESESDDDEDGEAFDKVDVDLGLFDVEEGDFHGLKALFGNLLDGDVIDSSSLAEDIINAKAVQSMIKTDEKDAPIGLISAINIKKHAGRPWMKELTAFLLKHAPEDKKGPLQSVLTGNKAADTALLFTERLYNCPPQISAPLLQFAEEELNYAVEDEDLSPEDRRAYDVTHFLLISRACVDPGAEEGEEEAGGTGAGAGPSKAAQEKGKKGKKKSAAAAAAAMSKDPVLYLRSEDEFLRPVADWSFTFVCPNRAYGRREVRPLRLVMLVPRGAVEGARRKLEKALAEIVM